MSPRRRHKAKARRAGRPARRAANGWSEMRPRTALLVMPTWWHAGIQRAVYMGATTVRFPTSVVLGWDRGLPAGRTPGVSIGTGGMR